MGFGCPIAEAFRFAAILRVIDDQRELFGLVVPLHHTVADAGGHRAL